MWRSLNNQNIVHVISFSGFNSYPIYYFVLKKVKYLSLFKFLANSEYNFKFCLNISNPCVIHDFVTLIF